LFHERIVVGQEDDVIDADEDKKKMDDLTDLDE
jgi:hypothetical protein